jgi:hypothetical protein
MKKQTFQVFSQDVKDGGYMGTYEAVSREDAVRKFLKDYDWTYKELKKEHPEFFPITAQLAVKESKMLNKDQLKKLMEQKGGVDWEIDEDDWRDMLLKIDSNREVSNLIIQTKKLIKQNLYSLVKNELKKNPQKREYFTAEWAAGFISQHLDDLDESEGQLLSLFLTHMTNVTGEIK